MFTVQHPAPPPPADVYEDVHSTASAHLGPGVTLSLSFSLLHLLTALEPTGWLLAEFSETGVEALSAEPLAREGIGDTVPLGWRKLQFTKLPFAILPDQGD